MNDREVYLRLCAVAEELTRMSGEAESLVGEAALQAAANAIMGAARAVYDHCLGGDEGVH